VFATLTKPDYTPIGLDDIRAVHERVNLPIFCIGGIKLGNARRVLEAGARRLVVVSGILEAADPRQYCRDLCALMEEFPLSPA
jgi:thiamine-phosphate pyrophosphorylase